MQVTGRIARRARQALKLLRLLPHPVLRRGLRFGVGAAIEHRGVLASLAPRTVVDVGAHAGQFSLLVRALHPRARIVAFEPLAGPAGRFRRVFSGDPHVTLHRAAIAPRRGHAVMHVSALSHSSSLLPITERQVRRFPGTGERGVENVATGPLDAFVEPEDIDAPALLKVDVQGYELQALQASHTLLHRFEHVLVEASFEELYLGQALAGAVTGFLDEHGFSEIGRFNVARAPDGNPVQADFLLQRRRG